MAIVPEEINYYKDKEGRNYIKVVNETSKLVPSIEYYDDKERTMIKVNNRKIIDHKKGDSFLQRLLQPKVIIKEVPIYVENRQIKQLPNEKTIEIENKARLLKWG